MTLFDVQRREYRHRELFETPVDEERLFPPDLRRERANALLQEGRVRVESVTPRETRKIKWLRTPEGTVRREIIHRDQMVAGAVAEQSRVELVLNDEERLIFATCGCDFFLEHILNQGPCEHMLALLTASAGARRDMATSAAVSPEAEALSRPPRPTEEGESGGAGEELDGEET
ncbi:MAG TPA: SWIM zinc finger family protein [Archangium sp.]|nr:SWIM zinc finger family protein [Archangium sp.]